MRTKEEIIETTGRIKTYKLKQKKSQRKQNKEWK